MENKSKNKSNLHWDWMSFLTNFTAVVLGIVLTFTIQKVIDNKNEKNDVEKSLQLVHDELVTNLNELLVCDTAYTKELQAADFLIKYENDFSLAPIDSLYLFANEPFILREMCVVSDAFELQKMSSLLQKIENQELSLEIIQTYAALNNAASSYNSYYEMKLQMWEKANGDEVKEIMSRNSFTAPEMWNAIVSSNDGKVFIHEIRTKMMMWPQMDEYIDQVKETIGRIEEYVGQ